MPFMSKKDLLQEHNRLIPLLEHGTLAERVKEANAQKIEAKAYIRKQMTKPKCMCVGKKTCPN
jgi:hypothetical protein